MDEIKEFRNFLGPLAKDYNEAELRQLRYEMHAMAELLLDIYLHKEHAGRSERSSNEHFDSSETES